MSRLVRWLGEPIETGQMTHLHLMALCLAVFMLGMIVGGLIEPRR